MKDYRYLFGPVPSRRLGRSLGVDLSPPKTCSFDCIFCQLGGTTNKTMRRAPYVPIGDVIEELRDWFERDGSADYITLSGSGEPTLHSEFGRVIEFVRSTTDIPVVLLSNATTLTDPDVRAAAARANVVKLSLSAWDQTSLETINRPCPEVRFGDLLEAQRRFRDEYRGELWSEVILLWGINSAPADVRKIADLVRIVAPDRVHLNTAVRPPAEDSAAAVPQNLMEEAARLFDPHAEVIAEYRPGLSVGIAASEREILAMVRRRPCTLAQIASAFGLHMNEVAKYLGKLTRTDQVTQERRDGHVYYFAGTAKEQQDADT